ncbi:MAG TPA: cation transporter [Mycobacterium sp.]|nr:cation transporter [Mycobacterium sp.]
MSRQTFTVTGLHCQSCVRSVSEALTALPDVTSVDVDLASDGRVRSRAGLREALPLLQFGRRPCRGVLRPGHGENRDLGADDHRRERDSSLSIALYASSSSV